MSLYDIPIHPESPRIVNAIIEIPKDTNIKYEYDPLLNIFKLDRTLCSAMTYPASYGFIPNTIADDDDPLDIIVFNAAPIKTGCLVECKVIGVLDMVDSGQKDWKVLGVPTSHIKEYNDLSDIDPIFLKIAKNFFSHYKDLDKKEVEVNQWHEKNFARKIVDESVKR